MTLYSKNPARRPNKVEEINSKMTNFRIGFKGEFTTLLREEKEDCVVWSLLPIQPAS